MRFLMSFERMRLRLSVVAPLSVRTSCIRGFVFVTVLPCWSTMIEPL